MRELEGDAHGGFLGQSALAPAGLLGNEFQHALHARSVEIDVARIGRGRSAGDARGAEKIKAELYGIFAGGVGELVGEGLKDPGVGIGTGGPKSVGRNAERHEGRAEEKILKECAGKLVAGDAGGGSELFAFAKANEMIAPGDQFAGRIETTLEEVKTGGAIVIVVKVVFAGPEELDRNANLFGDGAGLEHVVVGEAAAESTAGALQVNDDVVVGNIKNFGDEQAAIFRRLAGRPELELAVVVVSEAVFGLHGSVREEGIEVGGLDGFCGGLEGFVGVSVLAKGDRRRLLGKFFCPERKTFAALLLVRDLLPLGTQILAGGVGLPPSVSNDGYSAVQAEQIGSSGHGESMADARHRLEFVEISADKFASVDGALIVHRVQHSRNFKVNAIKILSCDDGRIVHALNGVADDFVVLGILELDGLEIGRGQRGSFFGECAIGEHTL